MVHTALPLNKTLRNVYDVVDLDARKVVIILSSISFSYNPQTHTHTRI